MDLKHLRTFVAVAENGTVSRAATRLRIAQPALSRQIIYLEAELGITLFDRVGHRLRLTREGEQLLGRSRTLLGYASSLADDVRALKRGDSGTLNVVASPQMIDNVFSTFLQKALVTLSSVWSSAATCNSVSFWTKLFLQARIISVRGH